LFAIFIIPYLSKNGNLCTNGIYEFFCIAVLFPSIVKAGASAQLQETSGNNSKKSSIMVKVSRLLGELSYPLYIVHYPIMYLFYSWLIKEEKYTLGQSWYAVIAVFAISLALAYITLKFYDLPLRKRLLAKAPVKDNS
jgi:peptidoglycan/LPS O-acetylase OafA/YrhL